MLPKRLLVLILLVITASIAGASQKVQDIRNNPNRFVNEVVTIEGFATQWVERTATSTQFYFLKDDWGGLIIVRTTGEKPVINDRYIVTGPVGLDTQNRNDIYISEESREAVGEALPSTDTDGDGVYDTIDECPNTPQGHQIDARGCSTEIEDPTDTDGDGVDDAVDECPDTPQDTDVDARGCTIDSERNLVWPLVGAIVVVLFIMFFLLLRVLRAKPGETSLDSENDVTTGPAPQVLEGRTIKMHAPPPGTLKLLPGRLEIAGEDEGVQEIRFYKVKGQSTPEITFGRAPGAPYTHVQLKPMTVSSRQAKLTYLNNKWILTNFAPNESNPTRLNAAELPVDGQAEIKEGDRIEMGEIVLIYRGNVSSAESTRAVVAGVSHVGRRPRQEDAHWTWGEGGRALLVVADGMGGHSAGEVASQIVIDVARDASKRRPESDSVLLERVADEANRKIVKHAASRSDGGEPGTTLVAAAISDGRLTLGHAGDSRAWLIHEQDAQQLTRDHSAVQDAIDRGVISVHEADESPYRHAIVRFLGESDFPGLDISEYGSIPEGTVVLLTSDGAHGHLTPADFMDHLSGTPTLQDGLQSLMRLAYHRGSDDNMTLAGLEWGRFRRSAVATPSPEEIPEAVPGIGVRTRVALGLLSFVLVALIALLIGVW